MYKILLIICLTLFTCLPVQANPVTILGIGDVELPQDIITTQGHDNKGNIIYFFKIKDGDIWRGAALFLPKVVASSEVGNFTKMDKALDFIVGKVRDKDKHIFDSENSKLIVIEGKEFAETSLKFEASSGGVIGNMDAILFMAEDGMKVTSFICADSDRHYWKTIEQKILSKMQ